MTNSIMKKIRKFDNKLETYEERADYIRNLYDSVEGIESAAMNSSELSKAIEDHATYLLNSKDVESGRKQEYGYYRNESDYRTNYSVGSNSITTDFSEREDLHEHYNSELNIKIESDCSLFYLDTMTCDQKKRLIKIGLKEKENIINRLSTTMQSLYDYIIDMLDSDVDKNIVKLCSEGFTELEIADQLEVSRRSINKRIKRICEKKI